MARNDQKKVMQNVALLALYEVLSRKAGVGSSSHFLKKRGLKTRVYRFALKRVERLLRERGLGGTFKRTWH